MPTSAFISSASAAAYYATQPWGNALTVGTANGLPFVVVGPAGSNYPYSAYSNDIGAALNAAGAALKAAKGGSVYIVGGVGTVYTVATQVVFYNTVNYIGDGVTLQAAASLSNPFITDTTNVYFSGIIAGLTLAGNAVAGSCILNLVSCQTSTFYDLYIQGASAGVTISMAGGSPVTYTNSSTIPQVVQVNANGATISALVVNGQAQNATTRALAYQVYTVLPTNTLVITYTVATPILTQCGVGVLQSIAAPTQANSYYKSNNVGNTFVSVQTYNCQVGWVLQGNPNGTNGTQITDNVYLDLVTAYNTIAGVVIGGNADTNTFTRITGHIKTAGAQMYVIGAYDYAAAHSCYGNVFTQTSFDTDSSATQIGVVIGVNGSIPHYFPSAQINAGIATAVQLMATTGCNCYIRNTVGFTVVAVFGALLSSAFYTTGSVTTYTNASPFILEVYVGATATTFALNSTSLAQVVPFLCTLAPGDTLAWTNSVAVMIKIVGIA
jgi:hypothetical protein